MQYIFFRNNIYFLNKKHLFNNKCLLKNNLLKHNLTFVAFSVAPILRNIESEDKGFFQFLYDATEKVFFQI